MAAEAIYWGSVLIKHAIFRLGLTFILVDVEGVHRFIVDVSICHARQRKHGSQHCRGAHRHSFHFA